MSILSIWNSIVIRLGRGEIHSIFKTMNQKRSRKKRATEKKKKKDEKCYGKNLKKKKKERIYVTTQYI